MEVEDEMTNNGSTEEERSEFVLSDLQTKSEVTTPQVPDAVKKARVKLAVITPRRIVTDHGKKRRLKLNIQRAVAKRNRQPKSVKRKASGEKEKEDDERTYEVECIINKRIVSGQLMYLVKWKGYKRPTWAPIENLTMCRKLVKEFEDELYHQTTNDKPPMKSSAKKMPGRAVKTIPSSNDRTSGNVPSSSSSVPAFMSVAAPRRAHSRTPNSFAADKNNNNNAIVLLHGSSANRPSVEPSTASHVSNDSTSTTSRATLGNASKPLMENVHDQHMNDNQMLDYNDDVVDVVSMGLMADEPLHSTGWQVLAVKRGSFPGQGPIAHVRNEISGVEEYISTTVLMRRCPIDLCHFYEEYLNLRP